MTVQQKNTFVRTAFVLLLLTLTSTITFTQPLTNQCEEGWTHFRDESRPGGMCYLSVNQPIDAMAARKFCEDRVSYLVNLDRIDWFKYNDTTQKVVTVPEFINANFKEFWSGMHIADNGRLMWHAFGPNFVKRNKGQSLPWDWKPDQPTDDVKTCGLVTLNKGRTVTGVPTLLINVEMLACYERRPFVCEKPAIQTNLKETDYCPEGWIGHPYLPYCLRLVIERVTFETARKRCVELGGGYLSVVNDPGFDSFNQSIVNATYAYQNSLPEQNTWSSFWIQSDRSRDFNPNNCTVAGSKTDSAEFYVGEEPCDSHLQFMCTRHVLTQTGDATYRRFPVYPNTIEVSSPYLDQASLLAVPTLASLLVSARFERPPADNEILFVKTPTQNFNPLEKTSGIYAVKTSMTSLQHYYVNVTLPPLPIEGVQEIPDDFNKLVYTCGYYSFSTYRIYPANHVETEPVLIRYSEKDLYIYVATVALRGEDMFTEQEANMRRLTKDESYTPLLSQYAYDVLYSFGKDRRDIANYRGLIEDVSFSPAKVKFRLFVQPTTPRSLPNDFEQVLVPVLQEHLYQYLTPSLFETDTILIKSTVTCPMQSVYYEEAMIIVTFPMTRAGEVAYSWERCYKGKGALALVECNGGYDDGTSWGNISYTTGCQTFPNMPKSSSTDELKIVSETIISVDNVETIIRDTANLTSSSSNLTAADIIYTAQIFDNSLHSAVKMAIPLGDIFDVTNNVIQADPYVISEAQEINSATNRILRAVDDITNAFQLNTMGTQTFFREYIASTVIYQSGENDLVIGLKLEKSDRKKITNQSLSSIGKPSDVNVKQTDTAIYLPRNVVTGETTRLSFHIYSKTELFSTPQGRYSVNSKVAAGRLERNGRPSTDLGDDRVTVVFEVLQVSDDAVCGYWDYSANEDAGGWRTKGCLLTRKEDGSKISCECDHLTNFAVLIDLEAVRISGTHKAILSLVTKVGLIISVIALSLIFITFIVFKHLRNGRGQQVLVNLSVAMLCSALIFLVGMDRAETKTGCKVVAVLLHYFILVSFAWMLVEGVLQYLRFVKVLGTYIPNFMKKSMIPAWGIPLIPVIIVLAIDHDLYYGGKGYCWLETKAMLYAFIIPVAIVIIANLFVFVLALNNICCRRNMPSNQPQRKYSFLHVQAGLSLFVILGLTWIFGFLAVNEAQVVFHYIFAILNAFQGLFIFLLFTVREPKIRKAWRKLCCKRSQYKHSVSLTGTESNPRKSSTDTLGSRITSVGSYDESPVQEGNIQ